jgi:hypothetical protein
MRGHLPYTKDRALFDLVILFKRPILLTPV